MRITYEQTENQCKSIETENIYRVSQKKCMQVNQAQLEIDNVDQ